MPYLSRRLRRAELFVVSRAIFLSVFWLTFTVGVFQFSLNANFGFNFTEFVIFWGAVYLPLILFSCIVVGYTVASDAEMTRLQFVEIPVAAYLLVLFETAVWFFLSAAFSGYIGYMRELWSIPAGMVGFASILALPTAPFLVIVVPFSAIGLEAGRRLRAVEPNQRTGVLNKEVRLVLISATLTVVVFLAVSAIDALLYDSYYRGEKMYSLYAYLLTVAALSSLCLYVFGRREHQSAASGEDTV